jgi:hypothetical protein
MNSSAFHELTGTPIRGILPLDLEPVLAAQKQHDATCVLPLSNNSKPIGNFYVGAV